MQEKPRFYFGNVKSFTLDEQVVGLSSSFRTLKLLMDANLTMVQTVNFVCSSCYFQMRKLHSVSNYLSFKNGQMLARKLILT